MLIFRVADIGSLPFITMIIAEFREHQWSILPAASTLPHRAAAITRNSGSRVNDTHP
jgi:hypothetical protein